MDISLGIHNPSWEPVYKISANMALLKGRHGQYHDIVKAAGKIQYRFGCYAWGTLENISYIGSFSKDYQRKSYMSNLHGRLHNYLQNHRIKETGQKNTNLMVFENINQSLLAGDVSMLLYKFDYLEFGPERVDYSQYCEDGDLVRAVERLLIYFYRRNGQCAWNRE